MKKLTLSFLTASLLFACGPREARESEQVNAVDTTFQWEVDQFDDLRILRYKIPGWDMIPLQQKQLA